MLGLGFKLQALSALGSESSSCRQTNPQTLDSRTIDTLTPKTLGSQVAPSNKGAFFVLIQTRKNERHRGLLGPYLEVHGSLQVWLQEVYITILYPC